MQLPNRKLLIYSRSIWKTDCIESPGLSIIVPVAFTIVSIP